MQIVRYAVRISPVLKYFGQLCIPMGVLTLVPLSVSLYFNAYPVSLRYGILVAGILALGSALMRLPAPKQLQTNEAMVITALIFLFTPLVMTWPIMASGLSFSDALFETISAVTTTGLSALPMVSDKPETFLFSRAWMQWVGGLGIVVLSLAVIIQPGMVAKRLGDLQDYEADPVGGTRSFARRIFTVYAVMTASGILLLAASGTGWFNAVLYTLAAVSTGGFSPHDKSLAGIEGPWAQSLVILLSVAGGISLLLYSRISLKNRQHTVIMDGQLRGYLLAGLFVSLLLASTLFMQDGLHWTRALYHGALNGFSAQSTAGFSSLDLSTAGPGSKFVLIISMFTGGGSGSTAGGIKILRLLILMRLLQLTILKAGMPRNAVARPSLDGRVLETPEIENALCLILVAAGFVLLSWFPFVVMGHNPLDALFEVVSALGTAGLSTGITGPSLAPLLKGILAVDMLLGRLEIFAWLILLTPGTWIGKRLED